MEDELTTDLDILSIIRVIIKKFWIILYIAIICAIGTDVFFTINYKPIYQTTSQFLVTAKENSTYSSKMTIISTKEMAEKFSYLLSSSVMAKEVAKNLGYASLPGTIETSVVGESSILSVTVNADSPLNAYNIMNNLILSYNNVSKHMDDSALIEPLDNIRMPSYPSNAVDSKRNLMLGFGGGALVSLGIIVLLELLKDDLKTEKHVEKKLDIKLFGTLYEEKRNYFKVKRKRSLLINDIATSFEYIENIKEIRFKLTHFLTNNDLKSVLITSTFENEGKTTLAVNLALSLAMTGAKVLLIDMDLKKPSLYKIFGLNKNEIISFEKMLKLKDYHQAINKNLMGIDVLANSQSYIDSELLIDDSKLEQLFQNLKNEYDYIIVDSAPVLVAEDTVGLSSKVDTTLFVARENYGKVRYINDAIDLIKEIDGNLIGCVLTRCFKLPFSKVVNYGRYHGYYENRYKKLFKDSQKEVKLQQGDMNE